MLNEWFNIDSPFYAFIIVTLLSLIIGLEQRRHHLEEEEGSDILFGTDRTFTFIGILGFILYRLDPVNKALFIYGGLVLSLLLAIFYNRKITLRSKYGLTSIIAALITYCLAPLVITQPKWFTLLIVVTVLVLTELKEEFYQISKKFDKNEFITLAKFLVIAFIILPNLPTEPVSPAVPISLYNMWLALVAVSGISYFSYLLRKFIFPASGVIITGLLGGLYSSTAVTLLMSKQSNEKISSPNEYAASVLFATAVLQIRVFLLLLIFNSEVAYDALAYLTVFFAASLATGYIILKTGKPGTSSPVHQVQNTQNPLEFRVALLFAMFYILFSFLTHYAEKQYGESGMTMLSFIAGLGDVDAFAMNVAQGKFEVSNLFIARVVMQAIIANNLIKMIYGLIFAEKKVKRLLLMGFSCVIIINIFTVVFLKH
jgi:uncharacterized membrane protein (DUF4010 family)